VRECVCECAWVVLSSGDERILRRPVSHHLKGTGKSTCWGVGMGVASGRHSMRRSKPLRLSPPQSGPNPEVESALLAECFSCLSVRNAQLHKRRSRTYRAPRQCPFRCRGMRLSQERRVEPVLPGMPPSPGGGPTRRCVGPPASFTFTWRNLKQQARSHE
jgi:hypothetical protein